MNGRPIYFRHADSSLYNEIFVEVIKSPLYSYFSILTPARLQNYLIICNPYWLFFSPHRSNSVLLKSHL